MNNTVYLCDCMDYMKGLPDNAFDLAIVDPPYGIGYEDGGQYYNGIIGKEWDSLVPDIKYFSEICRVSNNQIIWGGNYFGLPATRCVIAWTKTVELQNRTFSEWEMAWTSFQSPARWVNMKPFQRNGSRIHPTQKPSELYKWILKNYAKPGQTIFDSHVGSGSIRIACHDMGYDFTGCELDPDYHVAQEDRFNTHKAQGQLFDPVELTKNEYVQVAL